MDSAMQEQVLKAKSIIDKTSEVLIGKRNVVTYSVMCLLSGGHILLEDVPGIGKTTLARALAACINAKATRLSLTPDIMPSDITGCNIFNRATNSFEFKEGVLNCNFLLADEINRATPKTQSSLLEAMQESKVSVDGVTYQLPKPFTVIATQNPIEHAGTYPLPEAQLDRFLMKLSIGYPDKEAEKQIVTEYSATEMPSMPEPVASIEDILAMQETVRNIHISDALSDYIVRICEESRKDPTIALGLSPRAGIALCRAAKALAFLNGRDYAVPDDIKYIAGPVLAHRITVSNEARMRGLTSWKVITQLISRVPIEAQ